MDRKTIAFWGRNFKGMYSGGRIHAWMLAVALAENGHEVHFYTNRKPIFYDDFSVYDGNRSIVVHKNRLFRFSSGPHFDLVFLVPHLKSRISFVLDRFLFYPGAKNLKGRSKCKLVYVDFESPNWIDSVIPGKRPISLYKYSNKIIKDVDYVLSTTKVGMSYAKQYYPNINGRLRHIQLYLAINSKVADQVECGRKENTFIYFGRFNENHKGNITFSNIVKALPRDCKLQIIGNPKSMSKLLRDQISELSLDKNIAIEFHFNVSDIKKYELLARSKALFFNSLFEGYGMPPVEAQYVGTPVICTDLDVLREVNPNAIFVDFEDLDQLRSAVHCVSEMNDTGALRDSIYDKANQGKFRDKLNKIVGSILK